MRIEAKIAALFAGQLIGLACAQPLRILVQSSPLAGFQYYGGHLVWDEMHPGDRLALIREADNRHDGNAVRVEWRGEKLGYLPRAENAALAAEMDRGVHVEGRIGRMAEDPNPWKRLRVDVFVVP
jgi:hypothetical protein